MNFQVIYDNKSSIKRKPIKAWTKGVAFDEDAQIQLQQLAELPFIYQWIAR